jgi:hypothetical protein
MECIKHARLLEGYMKAEREVKVKVQIIINVIVRATEVRGDSTSVQGQVLCAAVTRSVFRLGSLWASEQAPMRWLPRSWV